MDPSPVLAALYGAAMVASLVEWRWSRSFEGHESYFAGREAQATHVVMNGGMAAMTLRPVASMTEAVTIACLVAVAVLVVRLLLERRAADGGRSFATIYHLLSLAAMVYAIQIMPPMTSGIGHMSAIPVGWAAWTLTVLFLLDGAITLALGLLMPRLLLRLEGATATATADDRVVSLIRLSSLPHLVMDAGMVVMLLGLA